MGEFSKKLCYETFDTSLPSLAVVLHSSCVYGIEAQVPKSFESKFDPQSVTVPQESLSDTFRSPSDNFFPCRQFCCFICQIGFVYLFANYQLILQNTWENMAELFSFF